MIAIELHKGKGELNRKFNVNINTSCTVSDRIADLELNLKLASYI